MYKCMTYTYLMAISFRLYDFYRWWKEKLFVHAQSIAFAQKNKVGVHKYLKLKSSNLLTKIRLCSHS